MWLTQRPFLSTHKPEDQSASRNSKRTLTADLRSAIMEEKERHIICIRERRNTLIDIIEKNVIMEKRTRKINIKKRNSIIKKVGRVKVNIKKKV